MRRFFDFSSSMSHFLGIAIYGRAQNSWWHSGVIVPLWKAGRRLHRQRTKLLYRFHPAHRWHIIDTKLTPGPHSGGTLVLHAAFAILMRSVEFRYQNLAQLEAHAIDLKASPVGNNPPELIDAELGHLKELINLVRWWTITRPADAALAKSLADLVYQDFNFNSDVDEKTGLKCLVLSSEASEHRENRTKLRALRKKIAHEETGMLLRLINLRGYLD